MLVRGSRWNDHCVQHCGSMTVCASRVLRVLILPLTGACGGSSLVAPPAEIVGGKDVVPLTDPSRAEPTRQRRQAAQDLDCEALDVEEAMLMRGHLYNALLVLRASGCGKTSLYLLLRRSNDAGASFADLARATTASVDGWMKDDLPARAIVDLDIQGTIDLRCPRDRVLPYATRPGMHSPSHDWVAEGCGGIARYDPGPDGLRLRSIDALCEPYIRDCPTCTCTQGVESTSLRARPGTCRRHSSFRMAGPRSRSTSRRGSGHGPWARPRSRFRTRPSRRTRRSRSTECRVADAGPWSQAPSRRPSRASAARRRSSPTTPLSSSRSVDPTSSPRGHAAPLPETRTVSSTGSTRSAPGMIPRARQTRRPSRCSRRTTRPECWARCNNPGRVSCSWWARTSRWPR